MGVFIEKEYRVKKSGGENAKPLISYKAKKAANSAFNHRASKGGRQKAISHVPSREVTLKVTGAAKTAKGIKEGISYITREGELNATLYDGNGNEIEGNSESFINEAADVMTQDNDYNLTNRNGENVEHVKNLIFSPPPIAGVKPEDSLRVTKEVMKKKYPDNAFVAAFHADKKEHPHVHVNIKIKNEKTGERINIRKQDLRELRQGYARELQSMGYDLKATYKRDHDWKKTRELEPAKMRDVYKLVDFGNAPYQFNADNKMSSFITYETLKNQKQTTLWGKELSQHFEPERLAKGDLIRVKKMSPTNIKTPLLSDDGEITSYRETKRNNWKVENLGVNRERKYDFPKEIVMQPTKTQIQMQLKNKTELKKSLTIMSDKDDTKFKTSDIKEQKPKIGFKIGF